MRVPAPSHAPPKSPNEDQSRISPSRQLASENQSASRRKEERNATIPTSPQSQTSGRHPVAHNDDGLSALDRFRAAQATHEGRRRSHTADIEADERAQDEEEEDVRQSIEGTSQEKDDQCAADDPLGPSDGKRSAADQESLVSTKEDLGTDVIPVKRGRVGLGLSGAGLSNLCYLQTTASTHTVPSRESRASSVVSIHRAGEVAVEERIDSLRECIEHGRVGIQQIRTLPSGFPMKLWTLHAQRLAGIAVKNTAYTMGPVPPGTSTPSPADWLRLSRLHLRRFRAEQGELDCPPEPKQLPGTQTPSGPPPLPAVPQFNFSSAIQELQKMKDDLETTQGVGKKLSGMFTPSRRNSDSTSASKLPTARLTRDQNDRGEFCREAGPALSASSEDDEGVSLPPNTHSRIQEFNIEGEEMVDTEAGSSGPSVEEKSLPDTSAQETQQG